jgi:hypothetical protein
MSRQWSLPITMQSAPTSPIANSMTDFEWTTLSHVNRSTYLLEGPGNRNFSISGRTVDPWSMRPISVSNIAPPRGRVNPSLASSQNGAARKVSRDPRQNSAIRTRTKRGSQRPAFLHSLSKIFRFLVPQKARGSEHSEHNLFKCHIREVARLIVEIHGHASLRCRQLRSLWWHSQNISPFGVRFLSVPTIDRIRFRSLI